MEATGQQQGHTLVWSAQERAVIDLICSQIDRKVELSAAYDEATDAKLKVRLSGEMRLLEQSAARLLMKVRTDVPGPESKRTVAARRAVRARWTAKVPRVEQPAGWVVPGFYAAHVPYRMREKRPDPRLWLGSDNAAEVARLD